MCRFLRGGAGHTCVETLFNGISEWWWWRDKYVRERKIMTAARDDEDVDGRDRWEDTERPPAQRQIMETVDGGGKRKGEEKSY